MQRCTRGPPCVVGDGVSMVQLTAADCEARHFSWSCAGWRAFNVTLLCRNSGMLCASTFDRNFTLVVNALQTACVTHPCDVQCGNLTGTVPPYSGKHSCIILLTVVMCCMVVPIRTFCNTSTRPAWTSRMWNDYTCARDAIAPLIIAHWAVPDRTQPQLPAQSVW